MKLPLPSWCPDPETLFSGHVDETETGWSRGDVHVRAVLPYEIVITFEHWTINVTEMRGMWFCDVHGKTRCLSSARGYRPAFAVAHAVALAPQMPRGLAQVLAQLVAHREEK